MPTASAPKTSASPSSSRERAPACPAISTSWISQPTTSSVSGMAMAWACGSPYRNVKYGISVIALPVWAMTRVGFQYHQCVLKLSGWPLSRLPMPLAIALSGGRNSSPVTGRQPPVRARAVMIRRMSSRLPSTTASSMAAPPATQGLPHSAPGRPSSSRRQLPTRLKAAENAAIPVRENSVARIRLKATAGSRPSSLIGAPTSTKP